MRKPAAILAAVLLILFAIVALMKSRSESMDMPREKVVTSQVDETEEQRFWRSYRRATDFRLAGQLEEAETAYQDALQRNATHEDALYYIGNVQRELGRFTAARAAWEKLVQVNSGSTRAFAQLGYLSLCEDDDALFDIDAAEEAYTSAMALNKEETAPILRLGQVALMRGHLEKARSYFEAVTASNFRSAEAHVLNSYIAWKQGSPERAVTLFTSAVEQVKPQQSPEGLSGEGDTKKGLSPLVSSSTVCEVFRPFTDGLDAIHEANLKTEMIQRFLKLDAMLDKKR